MVKYLLTTDLYNEKDLKSYLRVINQLEFIDKEYGREVNDFNLILDGLEPIFSKVLGERVIIDHAKSGIFRKPHNNLIHFESFSSLNEWCFLLALEPNTLNFYYHLKDYFNEGYRTWDSKNALEGYKFNYKNSFEWDVHTNILLEPNEGIFFRPWNFHSLNDNLIQYFRLISDTKFRILVIGDPSSSRSYFARRISASLPDSEYVNSHEVRVREKDIDFTVTGKTRHAYRILREARESNHNYVVIDMVCSLPEMRRIINPDILIWVNDQKNITIKDWISPKKFNIKINSKTSYTVKEIVQQILSTRKFNEQITMDY